MNIVMYHYIRKQSVRHGQLNYLRDHEFEKQLTFFEQNGGIVRIPSANSTEAKLLKLRVRSCCHLMMGLLII